ncbi:MAG: LacI family transcriptional regulator [Polaromonas sp.]|nr:LacI family transcriptional regulator [Polaromonas sp.]
MHRGFSMAPRCRRLIGALLAGLALTAQAQTYPAGPLRLIVQYPAGGALDVLARNVMQRASTLLGQPIIVDNRPGASGLIAFDACAKAPPDGYTMCLGTGEGMSFNPSLFPKMPYNAERDFTPVIDLVRISGVIVASADAPFNTVPAMVANARSKPGTINWASFGAASNPHIYLEWIKQQAKVDITHIPYKGSAQTIPALLSNEAQVTYVALGFVLPQIRAGKLKALAVTTAKRVPQLPDVPTLAELGLDPGFGNWVGVFVPAATPRTAVDRLNKALAAVVREPEFSEKFLAMQAFEPVGDSPDAFAAFVQADRAVARRVVQATGIQMEQGPAK